MHLPVSIEAIRRYIPKGLELDTYEKKPDFPLSPAEVKDRGRKICPLFIFSLRIKCSNVCEKEGCTGNLFSLDANKILAVAGARIHTLSYYYSTMRTKFEKRNSLFSAGDGNVKCLVVSCLSSLIRRLLS